MSAYYRWFPGDYMRDTIHLGWVEDCAYRRLIDLYQIHGRPIKNDRSYILRAVRANEPEQQAAVDTILTEYFELRADGWHQKKCDAEIVFRVDAANHAKKAAEARWKNKRNGINVNGDARALLGQSSGYANQNQNQNHRKATSTTLIDPDGFDRFWSAYPRHIAKAKAKTAWQALRPTPELSATIIAAISEHSRTDQWMRDDGKFIPHPATWLHQRRWEDQVMPASKAPSRRSAEPDFASINYREGISDDGSF